MQQYGNEYDVIHASPPCQGYSQYVSSSSSTYVVSKGKDEPRLIEPLRELLPNKPYIIENVVGALDHMRDPMLLCGVMFGLPIRRHRLFETNFEIEAPPHPKCLGVAKIYAQEHDIPYRQMRVSGKGRIAGTSETWKSLLGVDWSATQSELAEMIPPSYTEYIGKYFFGRSDIGASNSLEKSRP